MALPELLIIKEEFKQRRARVITEMGSNSVMILASGSEKVRSRDTHFSFRPDADFYYLTGFREPDSWLVIRPGAEFEVTLFCRPKDKKAEIWDGFRLGAESAPEVLSVDQAFAIDQLAEEMPKLLGDTDVLYFPLARYDWLDESVKGWVRQVKSLSRKGIESPTTWKETDALLHEMRLYKSPAELEVIREVADISARAHVRSMEKCRPGIFEYQLEAEYQHEFMRLGCMGYAYQTIVGGGSNACVLHYVENSDQLKDGDLVLVDAGGELDFYAGDITRTFPVNGQFSEAQKDVYQIVLNAQLAAIAEVKPGNSFNAPHEAAVQVITQGLIDLGWLQGELGALIEEKAYEDFYMHRTGHWLGLDVHDVGRYKIKGEWRLFQSGMVLTVEPGIYIAENQDKAPIAYRGMGIRIEDDVLVTEAGCEVLTAIAPKNIADIESLMAVASN